VVVPALALVVQLWRLLVQGNMLHMVATAERYSASLSTRVGRSLSASAMGI
jgi:hypothetical protein